MAMFGPPAKFMFKPAEWIQWIEEFRHFRTTTKPQRKDVTRMPWGDGKPIEFSEHCCSRSPTQILTTLHSWRSLLSINFIPKRNIINERCIFQDRVENASESVEEFVRELQTLTLHCDCTNTTEMVQDRFV